MNYLAVVIGSCVLILMVWAVKIGYQRRKLAMKQEHLGNAFERWRDMRAYGHSASGTSRNLLVARLGPSRRGKKVW